MKLQLFRTLPPAVDDAAYGAILGNVADAIAVARKTAARSLNNVKTCRYRVFYGVKYNNKHAIIHSLIGEEPYESTQNQDKKLEKLH